MTVVVHQQHSLHAATHAMGMIILGTEEQYATRQRIAIRRAVSSSVLFLLSRNLDFGHKICLDLPSPFFPFVPSLSHPSPSGALLCRNHSYPRDIEAARDRLEAADTERVKTKRANSGPKENRPLLIIHWDRSRFGACICLPSSYSIQLVAFFVRLFLVLSLDFADHPHEMRVPQRRRLWLPSSSL
jgi:hypothetical protein